MADIDKGQYNSLSVTYDDIETMPMSSLYQPLVETALGDCTGKTVLDLGGGTGLHARKAVNRGAKIVDVVDVSSGMLDGGRAIEEKLGRKDAIRWFEGDISKSLDHLPLEENYDIVMVNWTFDHAETNEELETMWANTARYTKSGGKLISIRMAAIMCESGRTGKYGTYFTDVKEIPGGYQFTYNLATDPPFSCPATTMTATMDFNQAKAMSGRHGFTKFEKMDERSMQVVKDSPEFWQLHLDEPSFIVITAFKE